jgi:hypothetical protein
VHGNAFERHTRANGKYPEERRPPRYIIHSGFFFVHPVAEETAKGPTKKKANRSQFHLDGCCFFPSSAFILENLLLPLHTCCRIVHLTQGEFVYLILIRSDLELIFLFCQIIKMRQSALVLLLVGLCVFVTFTSAGI